ncbi:hypothetical protein [Caldimonas brevitalea]|uniref:Alkaline phosphatase n=1 Tax=Caldimonas brevitalea TaxID=413882 RepID=A0A0G3BTN3_9BURK|nr:hypothetical protein [Caldimonas brevitalea]AKJ29880.1 alkaline phosphatase [Caldimonas brevitalea]
MAVIEGSDADDTLSDDNVEQSSWFNSNWSSGEDVMSGGLGNDLYFVNSAGDAVVEGAAQGNDMVVSRLQNYWLPDHVEHLQLDDTRIEPEPSPGDKPTWPAALEGYGNVLDNDLQGNANDNFLRGGGGDDRLYGGKGDDVLLGDAGDDELVATDNDRAGAATQGSLASGDDELAAAQATIRIELLFGGDGDDTLDARGANALLVGGRGHDVYRIVGDGRERLVEAVRDAGIDSVYSQSSYTLRDGFEHLTLAEAPAARDGRGNGLDNVLTGNSAANRLTGLAGDDTLWGGQGNDTLNGGGGDDRLDGAAGSDRLTGGAGGDRFVFGSLQAGEADTVADFSHDDDRLVLLDTLDAQLPLPRVSGLQGLIFIGGNVEGNPLSTGWFFKGEGWTGQEGLKLSGLYVNTLDGALWYNPTGLEADDAALLGYVSVSAAGSLEATDIVFGG